MSSPLVLETVNVPYSKQLDAQELAHGLLDHDRGQGQAGSYVVFFGEVEPDLQIAFAERAIALFPDDECEAICELIRRSHSIPISSVCFCCMAHSEL